jgi:alpha-1,6-mannosyltransferase
MKFARHYVRDLYNRFQVTLTPSEALAAVLQDWGVRNVRPVGLGVDTETFKPEPDDRKATRISLGNLGKRTLLLYVGRLAPEKNTATLCAAFADLEARRPGQYQLLVIGDGPQRDAVLERQRKGDSVTWIRYCADSSDLARYYRAADLFVHPGVQETFGLVALESQACGTPVVGIQGSYMDRIILHDQRGWARENSGAALSEAIETFSRNLPARPAAEMSDLASRLHSWPRVFEQLFCIYREVAQNTPRHDGIGIYHSQL